jgi:beta-glucosidase
MARNWVSFPDAARLAGLETCDTADLEVCGTVTVSPHALPFAPMADLARDPRWGRIAEGFGEDPWLGALDAAACVRGFQGTNAAEPNHVVACLKHFAGYGAAEGGRDYNTTEISEFTLRNFYLPPFKAGVDAGALTVMSAFNCLSGFPASANRHTLTDILRGEWKFSGFVVSDYESVSQLIDHGVAADETDAARLALTAGVDMEMIITTRAARALANTRVTMWISRPSRCFRLVSGWPIPPLNLEESN